MADLISLEDAAKILGIPTDELTELISKGEIRGLKTGSSFKFKRADLDAFLANRAGGSADDLSAEFDLADDGLQLASEGGSDVLASGEPASKDSPSDTGKMVEGSGLLLADDDLFDDELSLADASDIVDSDSDLESSDLVLDDDSSSEIGLASADSGINLSPSDSGLSLEEEPKELADSDLDALSLPEDEGLVALDDLGSDVRADDDFMLTPVEDVSDDDTSGSQVIALDDSEIYPDDSASGLLTDSVSNEEQAPVLVAEDESLFGGIAGGEGQAQPIAAPIAAEPPEAPYTIFQVLSLLGIFMILGLSMTLVIDNARNLWNAEQSARITDPVADVLIQMVGLKKD
ncbi:MAG TPA: hypothetical protein DCQ98_08920 [Planctomycetaceae bacterium]|nr:hypothetical protein [Planctomycetaceae bacterium]HRF02096.1 excisionase family DNA-binding protein [Pirellulaceae bacterium]